MPPVGLPFKWRPTKTQRRPMENLAGALGKQSPFPSYLHCKHIFHSLVLGILEWKPLI